MSVLGVDVGGTFTDFVAFDGDRVAVFKHLTTPRDPSVGVVNGARRISEDGELALSDLDRIIHGTTLVANSLIERRGSRTAMVTTRGFRDIVEIAREARYDIYDLALDRPEPLVPRPLRFELDERVGADGTVLRALDEGKAQSLIRELISLGVQSVAVCFLHSYVNPSNERRFADIAARESDELDVTLSSDVAPEWREFERGSTTCANAFVRPLVRRYLRNLDADLSRLDASDRLYVVLSHGGITSWEVASRRPIELVESGPAGGVMAAAYFGRRAGFEDVIAFDMGGTTTKISLIERGEPVRVSELEVARASRFKRGSGLPLKVPAIELIEIGAGGGSIAHGDSLGLLKVGPQSAGADPGAASYGRGGTSPTVTDADLLLGFLNPDYFLGGDMRLDVEAAREAVSTLARQLGLGVDECARGIFDIVNRQMALAMQTHVAERGSDPRRFALLASGGAGPVHAYEVARHLGIKTVVCPPIAGVASALGFLVSPFAIDLSRTYRGEIGKLDWGAVTSLYEEMEADARSLLLSAGASASSGERICGMSGKVPKSRSKLTGTPIHMTQKPRLGVASRWRTHGTTANISPPLLVRSSTGA
jgi:N-methylhydantoinase A